MVNPALGKIQEKQVTVYLFYGDGCPHCSDEKVFLEQLESENPNVK